MPVHQMQRRRVEEVSHEPELVLAAALALYIGHPLVKVASARRSASRSQERGIPLEMVQLKHVLQELILAVESGVPTRINGRSLEMLKSQDRPLGQLTAPPCSQSTLLAPQTMRQDLCRGKE